MSRKECSTGKGTLYASWNTARRAEVLGQVPRGWAGRVVTMTELHGWTSD